MMDAMTEETPQQKLARYEYVLDAQMKEIDKLRAENQRLTAEADAHTMLKSIYLNPNASEASRIKAAAAAVQFEKPKLRLVADSGYSLGRALQAARRRAALLNRGIESPARYDETSADSLPVMIDVCRFPAWVSKRVSARRWRGSYRTCPAIADAAAICRASLGLILIKVRIG
jgi:hypothetical protein